VALFSLESIHALIHLAPLKYMILAKAYIKQRITKHKRKKKPFEDHVKQI
jgi:hypothetical protein